MRTQPETRARSAQEAGKRALNLGASKANQACTVHVGVPTAFRAAPRRVWANLLLCAFCSLGGCEAVVR